MITVILPSAYFPPIPWLAAAVRSESAIIDEHEHYIKQTCRNRCSIITANGLMNLVIPVEKFRNHTPVHEIRIDYATDWQRVHEHAIRSAYGKSAFFEFYSGKILPLYEWQPEYLTEWNDACLNAICAMMKVKIEFPKSEEYLDPGTTHTDLRTFGFQQVQPLPAALKTRNYTQVFQERHGFQPRLSVLDLLFCAGPESREILGKTV